MEFNAPLIVVVPENVLFPAIVWLPEVLTTVLSTATVPELLVIPSPPVNHVAPST